MLNWTQELMRHVQMLLKHSMTAESTADDFHVKSTALAQLLEKMETKIWVVIHQGNDTPCTSQSLTHALTTRDWHAAFLRRLHSHDFTTTIVKCHAAGTFSDNKQLKDELCVHGIHKMLEGNS